MINYSRFLEAGNPRDIPVANHKAIHGLCVDPTSPQRLATYTEVEGREREREEEGREEREKHTCVYRLLLTLFLYRAQCTYGTSDTLQNPYPVPSVVLCKRVIF